MEGNEVKIDLTNNSASIIAKWVETSSDVSSKTIVTATAESGSALLHRTVMSIQQLKSNMYGFGITAKSAQKVVELFKTPQVIPSQILDYNAFPLFATRSGIQSRISMPITNCTCISIMFPNHHLRESCLQ